MFFSLIAQHPGGGEPTTVQVGWLLGIATFLSIIGPVVTALLNSKLERKQKEQSQSMQELYGLLDRYKAENVEAHRKCDEKIAALQKKMEEDERRYDRTERLNSRLVGRLEYLEAVIEMHEIKVKPFEQEGGTAEHTPLPPSREEKK